MVPRPCAQHVVAAPCEAAPRYVGHRLSVMALRHVLRGVLHVADVLACLAGFLLEVALEFARRFMGCAAHGLVDLIIPASAKRVAEGVDYRSAQPPRGVTMRTLATEHRGCRAGSQSTAIGRLLFHTADALAHTCSDASSRGAFGTMHASQCRRPRVRIHGMNAPPRILRS